MLKIGESHTPAGLGAYFELPIVDCGSHDRLAPDRHKFPDLAFFIGFGQGSRKLGLGNIHDR
jgi:hypothetical protein